MCDFESRDLSVPYETPAEHERRLEAKAKAGHRSQRAGVPATIWLQLRRVLPDATATGRKPVLLIHGASANHRSFCVTAEGLAKYLADAGFDPWLLDWRGSSLVVEDPRNDGALAAGSSLNFNAAALIDVPAAVESILKTRGVRGPISVMGHCMGGGILAEAIACAAISPPDVDRVVLQTLGLFYQTPVDGRLKSEDRILERLQRPAGGNPLRTVDPRIDPDTGLPKPAWPEDLDQLYNNWPSRMFHEPPAANSTEMTDEYRKKRAVALQCNRVSFMYGAPYRHDNLPPDIHGTDTQPPMLARQFGAIPLHMYIHAARNIREGMATTYNTPPGQSGPPIVTDTARQRFMALDRVTVITGALNRLWHRESIDLMHAWLIRGPYGSPRKVKKHVFLDFAHQDLLWATIEKRKDVYEAVAAAL